MTRADRIIIALLVALLAIDGIRFYRQITSGKL